MKQSIKLISLLLLMFSLGCGKANPKQDPVSVAEKWLKLIDEKKYEQSWDMASEKLRKSGAKKKWVEFLTELNKRLGKKNNRTIREQRKQKHALTNEDYLVLDFKSTYEKQSYVAETVTLIIENGEWQIAGYEAR